MNGRPTRSTRSQGRYAIVGDSSEEEEARSSDVPEAASKKTIKLRMPLTRSSNGAAVKSEVGNGDEYESVSRVRHVDVNGTAETSYRSRLRRSSAPSSPVVYASPESVAKRGDLQTNTKAVEFVEPRRRSSRLELAEQDASSGRKHVTFDRKLETQRAQMRSTRMVSLLATANSIIVPLTLDP